MENSDVAIIGIILKNRDSVEELNKILHEYADYIIGRMGIPYPKKGINVISIAIDAPIDVIDNLSSEVGKLEGVSCKVNYSKE